VRFLHHAERDRVVVDVLVTQRAAMVTTQVREIG
jgi:hypothetical protein